MDPRHFSRSEDMLSQPKTHRVAVVGGGTRGAGLADRLRTEERWHLAAVCDADILQARRLSRELAVASYETIDELLDTVEVDALAITTPLRTLYGTIMTALRAGKHVLVDRVVAESFERGKEIAAIADMSGLVVMVNNEHAYSPAVQRIRQLVKTGALGEILFINAVHTDTRPANTDKSVFWDLAPESFAVLDQVLPGGLKPFEVSTYGGDPLGTGRDRVGHINFRLPNDATVHLHVNQLSQVETHRIFIAGSELSVIWDAAGPIAQVNVLDTESALHQQYLPIPWAEPAQGDAWTNVGMEIEDQDNLRVVLSKFASCIDSREAARDSAAPALRVLAMMEAVTSSRSVGGSNTLVTAPMGSSSTGQWNESLRWSSW